MTTTTTTATTTTTETEAEARTTTVWSDPATTERDRETTTWVDPVTTTTTPEQDGGEESTSSLASIEVSRVGGHDSMVRVEVTLAVPEKPRT
jgi:hypothetical protein